MYRETHKMEKAVNYTTSSKRMNSLNDTKVSSYCEVVRAASGGGSSGSGGASVIAGC